MLLAFLFCLGLFTGLTSGSITNDEAWFLRITGRFLDGEVPYRDFFLGVTPLSLYITSAACMVLGTQLVTLKLVMAVAFAALAILSFAIASQLGLSHVVRWLLVLAIAAYVPSWVPGAGAPYTPLSQVMVLGSLASFLTWQRDTLASGAVPSTHGFARLALPWAAAGVAFAIKQSAGVYCMMALGICALLTWRRLSTGRGEAVRKLPVALVSTAVAAGLPILPVLLTDGGAGLLDYGFLNKTTYVQVASISYSQVLEDLSRSFAGMVATGAAGEFYWKVQLLLPFPAAICIGLAIWRSSGRRRTETLAIATYAAAAFADVFPRAGVTHTSAVVPILLLSLAWGWHAADLRLPLGLGRLARMVTIAWLALGLGYLLVNPIRAIASGEQRPSDLPHLRGALVNTTWLATAHTNVSALMAASGQRSLFIVSADASIYYLAAGIDNPTPFDYPLVTAFGLSGEEAVIDSLRSGRLQEICVAPMGTYYLRPARLQDYVLGQMEPVREAGPCTLFRRRPS